MPAEPTGAVPVSGLVLDLDDTLIDTRAAMTTAGALVAADLWPQAGDAAWAAFGERVCADPRQFYQRYARGELEFPEMRRLRFEEAREHLGLADVGERFATFETSYWSAFEGAQQVFDDTTELLDAADAAGVPMVLLTNSSLPLATMKLRAAGLADRFVSLLTTHDYGVGKPDPRLFTHAGRDLAGHGAQDPAGILSVGDHLGRDIVPAIALGMQAAWLVRPGAAEQPPADLDERVRVVSSLSQVTALLPTVGGAR